MVRLNLIYNVNLGMKKGEVKWMKDEKIDASTSGGCLICENPTEEIIILLN